MTDVLFLASVQGYQARREQDVVDRLKADRPDLTIRVLSPGESGALLARFKLKFGPAVVIDNRLEFIGIPRYRMLVERVEIAKRRASAPAPPSTPSAPAAPAAVKPTPIPPAKPGAPG